MCVSFIPLLIFSTLTTRSMTSAFIRNSVRDLSRSAVSAADQVNSVSYMKEESVRAVINADLDDRSREGLYRILIFDDTSFCVSDTNHEESGKTLLVPEVLSALSGSDSAVYHPESGIVYAAAAIVDESSGVIGAALLVSSIKEVLEPIRDAERSLLTFMVVTLAAISILIVFISRFLIEPLNNVFSAVQKMSDGNLNARTVVNGRDEFSEMGRAFNIMAEKLELADDARNEFVSNVSHELKTPLSAIKVLAESVLSMDGAPMDMYVEFMRDINSEVDRMTFIVNDLLNLVKMDGGAPINIAPADLNQMAIDLLNRLLPLARRKSINLLYEEIRGGVSAEVDEIKLSLAISNIVENAVKYTGEGGEVKIIVDGDHQNAFITVSDTGIGISEENQTKVFTRFYRVDKTRDRETGGTGLGLAITHSTVLMLGGSVRLVSKLGEGSSFTVRIPLKYRQDVPRRRGLD
ncbi:MAG: HAMP domain-containing histidine kinase [Clostridiales bacterium]|jgi:signal transduction histidine kinase|nr:HAMP domain-containing histidine kinase [Clostridiales bacterium]